MLRIRILFQVSIMFFTLTSLSGCKVLSDLLQSTFKKPTMEYKKIHLKNLSFKGIDTDFEFELDNPNNVEVTFAFIEYQLDLDDKLFVKGRTSRGLKIRANAKSPIFLPFGIEFKKFAEALLTLFQKKESIRYRLQVKFGFDTPIGVIPFPFDLAGTIPLPKLPAISFRGAKLAKIGFTGATLIMYLAMKNRSDFPVQFSGLDYSVALGGKSIMDGVSSGSEIKKGEEQIVKIPVTVNFLSVGMALYNIIQSKKLPYKLGGNLNLGLFKLPFALEGNASL